jgi:tyrosyl-tRNA synthetase
MPGTEEQLMTEMTAGYVGFDPTADSLHIGSLVPIILLVHLQKAGHKPIALVGGATGMVGDPSGKNEERNLLSEETLQHNLKGVKKQLEKFLDFHSSKTNAAEMVNNYDWFKEMKFLDFIRETGKHITVNYMMAKESVRKRIEGDSGMSFTEFSYQLVQGYDFYWLFKNKNCKLQMGGSDQWGNIVTGTELIRRKTGGQAFAFTCPLMTKSDGGKFGKTEKGNVWLDPEKTPPFEFYKFWINASDDDAEKWIKIFTFLDEKEIASIVSAHKEDPGKRILQKKLADEVTTFVHGEESTSTTTTTTLRVFDNNIPAEELTTNDLLNMAGSNIFKYASGKIKDGVDVVSFLAESRIFSSKGEARKTIQGGGVSINRYKVNDAAMILNETHLLHKKYILVQKGKKNYFLVEAV